MSKTDQIVTTFSKIERSTPFTFNTILYSRKDKTAKDYRFFKTGRHRAITADKRTAVHFIGNEMVAIHNNND